MPQRIPVAPSYGTFPLSWQPAWDALNRVLPEEPMPAQRMSVRPPLDWEPQDEEPEESFHLEEEFDPI